MNTLVETGDADGGRNEARRGLAAPLGDEGVEVHDDLAEATARLLAETLGLEDCDEDDLYAAMDWLLKRQDAIERRSG